MSSPDTNETSPPRRATRRRNGWCGVDVSRVIQGRCREKPADGLDRALDRHAWRGFGFLGEAPEDNVRDELKRPVTSSVIRPDGTRTFARSVIIQPTMP